MFALFAEFRFSFFLTSTTPALLQPALGRPWAAAAKLWVGLGLLGAPHATVPAAVPAGAMAAVKETQLDVKA
jgi:hypothetical protein